MSRGRVGSLAKLRLAQHIEARAPGTIVVVVRDLETDHVIAQEPIFTMTQGQNVLVELGFQPIVDTGVA